MKILQPPGWAKPRGYANGVAARGTLVFVAGQIGWNADGRFETNDFVEQARQALANIVAVLAEAGARPEHIVRMTWYVTDKREYLAAYAADRSDFPRDHRLYNAAMTAVEVTALIEDAPRSRSRRPRSCRIRRAPEADNRGGWRSRMLRSGR